MEKKIRSQKILIILLAVLLIFNFFTLLDVRGSLNNLENNMSYRFDNISQRINSIYSEIADINDDNKAEASLITSFEYEYGELDESSYTVPVKVKIVPKAVSDDTELLLEFEGRTVEMKKREDSLQFTAEFEKNIFEQSENDSVRVVIKSKGISESEELDWQISDLVSEFLPSAVATFVFDDTVCSKENGVVVDGTVAVFIDDDKEDAFKNAKLIYKFNGKVAAEEETNGDEHIQIRKAFPDYGIGDTLEFYFEAEDSFGFIHESLLKKITFTEYGEVETEALNETKTVIKDKEGKVLSN